MFPVFLADESIGLPLPVKKEVFYEENWEAESYWGFLWEGGPVVLGLHALMVVACVVTVVLALRRGRSSAPCFVSLLPFALGSMAMWLGALNIRAILETEWGYPAYFRHLSSQLPRPFYLGTALSAALLVVVALLRKARRPPAAP